MGQDAKQNKRGVETRQRIIAAVAQMLGEELGSPVSVRAVAARAGVSAGSLRYHFPTQRELLTVALGRIYDVVAPADQRIHDRSVPARDRLVDCLRSVLAPAGAGVQAREAVTAMFHAFIETEPTEEVSATYLAMEGEGRRRMEYWLSILIDEGVLLEGDNARRARFLGTVLTGLSFERALPAGAANLEFETATLYDAVDSILGTTHNLGSPSEG